MNAKDSGDTYTSIDFLTLVHGVTAEVLPDGWSSCVCSLRLHAHTGEDGDEEEGRLRPWGVEKDRGRREAGLEWQVVEGNALHPMPVQSSAFVPLLFPRSALMDEETG